LVWRLWALPPLFFFFDVHVTQKPDLLWALFGLLHARNA